ncbi:hypothetical protein GCM10008986_19540 [Salinibacillus aidingensis]|uniref:HTH luxR-type domain-containing protein n=1 Tax=Salinibacillus aidingensis TaxID=237684 RepID=A0ABP3L6E6_9BACI
MRIALLKEPSLMRDILVHELKSLFPTIEFTAYGPEDQETLQNDYESITLLIIDLDTNMDESTIIDFYKSQNIKIAVWFSTLDNPDLFNLLKLNLNGYFFNGMEKEELTYAIQTIINGKRYVHPEINQIFLNDYSRLHNHAKPRPVGVLSKREWEVLELLTKGYKNQEIAKFLFITEKTVKIYVSSILRTLEVEDRTNAVLTAIRNKWFVL